MYFKIPTELQLINLNIKEKDTVYFRNMDCGFLGPCVNLWAVLTPGLEYLIWSRDDF